MIRSFTDICVATIWIRCILEQRRIYSMRQNKKGHVSIKCLKTLFIFKKRFNIFV